MTTTFDYEGGLRDGLRAAAWDAEDLWLASFAFSGHLARVDIEDFLSGRRAPSPYEFNILAAALNERLVDQGTNSPVYYWELGTV